MQSIHLTIVTAPLAAALVAGLLDRITEGDTEASVPEEAHSRLLLAPVPRGANTHVEFAKRFLALI